MTTISRQSMGAAAWELAGHQDGVIEHQQLRDLGYSEEAIRNKDRNLRLHQIHRGVYAVGRPDLPARGRWRAALLACGPDSALSHRTAGVVQGLLSPEGDEIEVSVPGGLRQHDGVRCHRRVPMPQIVDLDGLRVTTPAWTIVDLASQLQLGPLIEASNSADRLGLLDHDEFRALVESLPGRRGIRKLRVLLGSIATQTDSFLERRFLKIVDGANIPRPQTQVPLLGYRVDFLWPDLRLVVETDGLTYHRTPAQQAADRKRDQTLSAAGYLPLRFTNAQIRDDPRGVREVLLRVVRRSAQQA